MEGEPGKKVHLSKSSVPLLFAATAAVSVAALAALAAATLAAAATAASAVARQLEALVLHGIGAALNLVPLG